MQVFCWCLVLLSICFLRIHSARQLNLETTFQLPFVSFIIIIIILLGLGDFNKSLL